MIFDPTYIELISQLKGLEILVEKYKKDKWYSEGPGLEALLMTEEKLKSCIDKIKLMNSNLIISEFTL